MKKLFTKQICFVLMLAMLIPMMAFIQGFLRNLPLNGFRKSFLQRKLLLLGPH